MKSECTADTLQFQEVGGRAVVGRYDGGTLTSDGGAVLLREVERATGFWRSSPSAFTIIASPRACATRSRRWCGNASTHLPPFHQVCGSVWYFRHRLSGFTPCCSGLCEERCMAAGRGFRLQAFVSRQSSWRCSRAGVLSDVPRWYRDRSGSGRQLQLSCG